MRNLILRLTLTPHIEGKQKWSTVNFRVLGPVPPESVAAVTNMHEFVKGIVAGSATPVTVETSMADEFRAQLDAPELD